MLKTDELFFRTKSGFSKKKCPGLFRDTSSTPCSNDRFWKTPPHSHLLGQQVYPVFSVHGAFCSRRGKKSISRINFKTTSPMLKIQCSSQDRQKKIQTSSIPRPSVTSNLTLLTDYEIVSQENIVVLCSLSSELCGDIGDKQGT